MEVKNCAYVRDNLIEMINKVNDDNEPILITSNDYNAVLISESEYNKIAETLYLQENKANAKHLNHSIETLEKGK